MRQPSPSTPLSPVIVLVAPQLGENIGTAARAMANFGLSDLRLVNPREGWPNKKAHAAASGADGVIEQIRTFPSTGEAIADLGFVYATTARAREVAKPVAGPREAATRVRALAAAGTRAGVMFGPERAGLTNEDLSLADEILTFPVDPGFPSLNLAQAVLLFAYEWRLAGFAASDEALPLADARPVPAPKEELIRFFEHFEVGARRGRLLPPAGEAPAHGRGASLHAPTRRLLRAGGADASRRRHGTGGPPDAAAPACGRHSHHRARQGQGMSRLLVFDSGVGGLSVAAEIRREHPRAEITYVADDAGFPYGEWEDAALSDRVVGLIARPHRPIRSGRGGHRLQHRLDAGAAAAPRPLRHPLRRHRAGDQAGGGADAHRRGQRARYLRHHPPRLYARA